MINSNAPEVLKNLDCQTSNHKLVSLSPIVVALRFDLQKDSVSNLSSKVDFEGKASIASNTSKL